MDTNIHSILYNAVPFHTLMTCGLLALFLVSRQESRHDRHTNILLLAPRLYFLLRLSHLYVVLLQSICLALLSLLASTFHRFPLLSLCAPHLPVLCYPRCSVIFFTCIMKHSHSDWFSALVCLNLVCVSSYLILTHLQEPIHLATNMNPRETILNEVTAL
ncbi:hypothetical protein JB92DRAFT_408087 [Gautieria morchelliformis]|nr:hypothetical protein JB92DRAFT_408087 [Gautieria morchelliformis]